MKKLVFTLLTLSSAAALIGCSNPRNKTPDTQPMQSFKSMAQNSALSSISMYQYVKYWLHRGFTS